RCHGGCQEFGHGLWEGHGNSLATEACFVNLADHAVVRVVVTTVWSVKAVMMSADHTGTHRPCTGPGVVDPLGQAEIGHTGCPVIAGGECGRARPGLVGDLHREI